MNIRRIARLAGLSRMTVSRALDNSPLVAQETRTRVLDVAESLGYRINAGTRTVATGLTTTIGVLYPYHRLREVESWYTSQLIHDIRSALWEHDFDSMIAGYDTADHNLSDITRLMAQKKVDGLVVIGYEVTAEALEALAAITDRYIAVNPPRAPWMNAHPGLYIDQELGGALASQTLRSSGRVRVATVLEPTAQFEARYSGFSRDVGDDVPVFHLPDGTYGSAYDVAVERGTELTRFDGLFVGSDISALGVMNGLLDRGIRVPEEVAIVGFDDIEWARYARPALTTVHQPRREVAAAAAERVVAAVQEARRDPFSTVFQPHVISRESC